MSTKKDKKVQVLLSEPIWDKFRLHCEEEGVTMSECLRDVVKDILKNKQSGV
jgi:hypothetical protein